MRRPQNISTSGGFTRQQVWARGARMLWCIVKRTLLVPIIFNASVCMSSAQDAQVSVDMIGIGSTSCAHWRTSNSHRLEGTVWIHGFWTGLNYVAAASGQTQPRTRMSSVAADVEKVCARKISQTLANAVWATYLEATR